MNSALTLRPLSAERHADFRDAALRLHTEQLQPATRTADALRRHAEADYARYPKTSAYPWAGAFEIVRNAQVCGFLWTEARDWPLDDKRSRHILLLHIQPQQRGKGIAQAILRQYCTLAAKNGVKALSLHVADTNLAAKKVYEKLGFRREQKLWTKYLQKSLSGAAQHNPEPT